MRRVASAILLVVAGVLFPVFVIANWAGSTLYDSSSFSKRAVEPLNSEAVRRELARRLTGQLVQAGNQQATEFRPAVQLALEGVIDTDTFKSIFRNSVRRTHEAIIQEEGDGRRGLDLGASFSLITSSLQARGGEDSGAQQGAGGLDNSLSDVTRRVDDLGLWTAEGLVGEVTVASFIVAVGAAVGSVLLAEDRRRAVRRLGIAAVIGGLFIVAFLVVAGWLVGRTIEDGQLADAIKGALREVTSDLRLSGLWIAAYGLVIAAAVASVDRRYTPAEVWRRARGWVERRRQTTRGTVLLGVLGLFISVIFIQEPLGNFELLIRAAALWVGYLAITELLRLVRTITERRAERRALWPRLAGVGATLVVVAGLVTVGFVLLTQGASEDAEAADEQVCNTEESLCELRIDQVTFPGVHHAFASAEYPGYLFAQQQGTITQQLRAGVRSLNVDTYYGVPSTARIPGQDTPIILTDRAATAAARAHAEENPEAERRAAQLVAGAPRAADAQRAIYMCHANCETGAIEFSDGLEEITRFMDTHPNDVLLLTLHDFTSPADTAEAIETAGLADRAATLQRDAPLPTLRELIESGRTLLVFAERGDPGGPPWYHSMYDWFQETTFAFSDTEQFDCAPNRGPADAQMFLINHWLTLSPPNPQKEASANSRAVLEERIQRCLSERGLVPNILQVQFAERGDLFATVDSLNSQRLEEERAKARAAEPPAEHPPQPTAPDSPLGQVAPLPETTVITTLTGGDPDRFCQVLPAAELSLNAWAVAILHAETVDQGLTDFAYGPLLARDVRRYVDAAPEELASRAAPILERARDAVARLRELGLADRDIKRLARSASDMLAGSGSPDALTVRNNLVAALEEEVERGRLRQAATEFASAHGDPTPLLDLGFVPEEVGIAAGYPCAADGT
jgi:hypothetical protein